MHIPLVRIAIFVLEKRPSGKKFGKVQELCEGSAQFSLVYLISYVLKKIIDVLRLHTTHLIHFS